MFQVFVVMVIALVILWRYRNRPANKRGRPLDHRTTGTFNESDDGGE